MNAYEKLLSNNKSWATKTVEAAPDYFRNLAIQNPEFLWIGCSDSRVPANQITGTHPGEIFVHRNIANLVIHTDVNLLSVLEYAVVHLKVKHVIVCGHYGCGGIKAAMTNHDFKQVLNMWLRNIKDVYRLHRHELEAIADPGKREDRLTELNVQEQVLHLAKTSIIQRAWQFTQSPELHGWVYGLSDGILNPVFRLGPDSPLDSLYRYDDMKVDG
ncbi:MAG: carbonic anhydrase [Bacteroidota bacterium]|nr:carbonic anhydrase [Bacteroidota bacterium]MDP4212894.1 carbonic anhydrase [Bacteroidota bacterium]MDP4249902.1 carbonic anhydrase [Bacteroidota bacterium]